MGARMEKKSYSVKKLDKGVYVIDEYAMNYMYIVIGTEKCLAIDTGTGTGDYKSIVDRIAGDKPYDVVCTHCHVDHCGGIGQFRKIYIHPNDIAPVVAGNGRAGTISVANRRRYSARGFAVNPEGSLPFTLESFQEIDTSTIEFVGVREGDTFDLGNRSLTVYEMPGHSMGCICLLDKANQILFAGDNVSKILILPMDLPHKERVQMWLTGAEKILALRPYYSVIYAGHLCPAPMELFLDQVTLARKILTGEIQQEFLQADEFRGPLYRYGEAYFTLEEENLKTRDYRRILHPDLCE
ncbi:Glyoxylase, beta-lactamase superfamily II [Oscillibacter sp. PC13]|nr:Glyoxylase, beta-lactamase superfamily II [Oscillibacter sp. PC13]